MVMVMMGRMFVKWWCNVGALWHGIADGRRVCKLMLLSLELKANTSFSRHRTINAAITAIGNAALDLLSQNRWNIKCYTGFLCISICIVGGREDRYTHSRHSRKFSFMYGVDDVQSGFCWCCSLLLLKCVVDCVNFKRFRFVGTYNIFYTFCCVQLSTQYFIIFNIYFVYYSQNRVVLFANVLSHNAFEEFSILVDCCGISGTVCNNELECFGFCTWK